MIVCDINLIAARRRQKQQALTLMRLAVYSLIALSIGMLTLYGYMVVETRLADGRISDVDAALADPGLTDKAARITFVESSIADLQPRVDLLEKVHNSEHAWIHILRDVAACMPPGVGLSSLTSERVDKGQAISIKGKSTDQGDIGQFMLALDAPAWSGTPRLGYSQITGSRDTFNLIEFEITVPLNKIIGSDLK
jgi:Tfp pilus assembly protein PilN